jgi:hypothetical protein
MQTNKCISFTPKFVPSKKTLQAGNEGFFLILEESLLDRTKASTNSSFIRRLVLQGIVALWRIYAKNLDSVIL